MPQIVKYYPEDTDATHGTLAIKLPMNNNRSKGNSGLFNMSYTTEEQSVSNYVNLLLTLPGERYMQPEFGIGIQRRIFEQNTVGLRSEIQNDIETQSRYWLPYIVNHRIDISDAADIPSLASDSENGIHIKITFSVTEVGANKTIVIFGNGGVTNVRIE